jgi:hypothetical protein
LTLRPLRMHVITAAAWLSCSAACACTPHGESAGRPALQSHRRTCASLPPDSSSRPPDAWWNALQQRRHVLFRLLQMLQLLVLRRSAQAKAGHERTSRAYGHA